MSIVSFIVIAIAFGISAMLLMRRCAEVAPIPLSEGLLVSFTVAVVHAALYCLGIYLGNILRFELPDNPDAFTRANSFVLLGLSVFVALKMVWPYLNTADVLRSQCGHVPCAPFHGSHGHQWFPFGYWHRVYGSFGRSYS